MHRPSRAALAREVAARRSLLNEQLTSLLRRSDSTATLHDIRTLIFNETDARHPSEYFSDLIAMFDADRIDIDATLPVIQDAWNYFPHRRYNGECAYERFLPSPRP
jgi:hypothetical protein